MLARRPKLAFPPKRAPSTLGSSPASASTPARPASPATSVAQYGQLPEIRLIIQPIIKNPDGSPKVLDIAGHLIFDFIVLPPDPPPSADCFPRFQPDMNAFNSVVADVAALRTKLNNGQLGSHAVSTVGVPLGIHPGLADPATANSVRNEMLSFLEKHISAGRLGSMAIAGLPANAPAPWIFLSIARRSSWPLLSRSRTDPRRRPAIRANAKSRRNATRA